MKNNSCRVFANAKINLHLQVTGKRPDGYHNISSVMQSVDLCDEILITLNNSGTVTTFTENKIIDGENLVTLAAIALLKESGSILGADIVLKKRIPLSAGVGGGSADAAAVLTALNKMLGEPISKERLFEIALSLGADVPFCLEGGTQKCEGLGEVLTNVKLSHSYYVVLVKHHQKRSTGHMYSLIDKNLCGQITTQRVVQLLEKGDLCGLKECSVNDFLKVSNDKNEQLEICNKLYEGGAAFSGLSGSGPTLFALFERQPEEDFLKSLREEYKEVYLCKTTNIGCKIADDN